MTDYTALSAKHPTLAANTMDSVTLSLSTDIVEIINRDTTNPIYATVGVTPLAGVPNATVAGDNVMVIPGGQVRTVRVNATPTTFGAVDIAAVVLYAKACSVSEQQQVEAYLKAKYGTP